MADIGNTVNERKCCKCGEVKQLDDFNRDNSKPLGRTYKCIACTRKTVGPPKNPRTNKRCEWCLICFSFKPGGGNMDGGKYCSIYCHHAYRSSKRKPTQRPAKTKCNVSFIRCKWCGEMFCRKGASEYCSEKCRSELSCARNKAQERQKKDIVDIECKECGSIFSTSYGKTNSVFCSNACADRHSHRIGKQKRRAMKMGATVEVVDPIKVFRRDGYTCMLCGKKTAKGRRGTIHPRAPELDHIVPLSRGGEHSYRNTQCACRACNSSKNNRLMGQLRLCG